MKRIITSGSAYTDIDALACAAAYKELLTRLRISAQAVLTGDFNQTIPESVRAWPFEVERSFREKASESLFVLVDISHPDFVDSFVPLDRVVEVFDHHFGHEAYWQSRLPESTYIERVGACATQIWEQFKKWEQKISPVNANLLYTAIFANTLDFKSPLTTERDRAAAEELLSCTALPRGWRAAYYREVASGFEKDLALQVQKDTKMVHIDGASCHFGQVELWDARPLIDRFVSIFGSSDKEWLINIASIEEGRSYLYSNSPRLRAKVRAAVPGKALNDFQVADRLWLRKELLVLVAPVLN